MMTLIQINREIWEGVPLLICEKTEFTGKPLPTMTYLHGITGAKEDNLSIGYLLAERGFRVVLPDAHLHGEREQSDIESLELHFFDIIQKSIAELAIIFEKLNQDRLIKNGSFTLAGTSMGGITTAAALTNYPWISQAGIMMGTALFQRFAKSVIQQTEASGVELPLTDEEIAKLLDRLKHYDLSLNLDQLQNRPLFIWHGEKDQVVPFQHATDFYEQLKQERADAEAITFVSEKNTGHKVSRQARLALVDWISQMNRSIKQAR